MLLPFTVVFIVEARFYDNNNLAKYTTQETPPPILSSLEEECLTPCARIGNEKEYRCNIITYMYGHMTRLRDFCSPTPDTAANGMKCLTLCYLRGGHSYTNCLVNTALRGEQPKYEAVACSISLKQKQKREAALKKMSDERMIARVIDRIMKQDQWRMDKVKDIY